MITVHKYDVPPSETFALFLPAGAQFLHLSEQYNGLFLWVKVDLNAPPVQRNFRLIGTGMAITETNLVHVGSALMHGGELVWHLFEVI